MIKEIKKTVIDTGLAVAETALNCFGVISPITALRKGYELVSLIAEQQFNDKLMRFFKGVENVPEEDKEFFGLELGQDREAFFKRIIMVLDKYEDVEKADLAGNLFNAAVSFEIEVKIFNRLVSTVEKLHLEDLNYLHQNYNKTVTEWSQPKFQTIEGPNYSEAGLIAAGLLEEDVHKVMHNVQNLVGYKPTELGLILIKFGFQEKSQTQPSH